MKNVSKWISIALMVIFGFSTLAYSLIQGSRFSGEYRPVTLPNTPVLSQPMSKQQELLALQKGYTLIYLNYSSNFSQLKNYLESFAYKQKDQVFLIEMPSRVNSVDIKSMKGETTLKNPNVNETENTLCNYLLKPPLECVLRQV